MKINLLSEKISLIFWDFNSATNANLFYFIYEKIFNTLASNSPSSFYNSKSSYLSYFYCSNSFNNSSSNAIDTDDNLCTFYFWSSTFFIYLSVYVY